MREINVAKHEGWVECNSDTQSLRTISPCPALHARPTSQSSGFSDFEAIDVGEASCFSEILNLTNIGLGFSFASTSRTPQFPH
ncbi:hypothetical protein CPB83DRAFT_852420 [Crepidotus variabilis]|uniref:Uncharacterized protein n=1 Tax=Crepidotus variabilis TaxID=179855 RepID=A0A9P6EH99_9AGAR|nr:hypothetical protein CPB83DRAFT_852420 [Crepidotus variabilis]